MATIQIYDPAIKATRQAEFAEVRRARNYALGWATVIVPDTDGVPGTTLRFPALVDLSVGRVATARDWQAPFAGIDLSDPADVDGMSTGQERMIWPKTGNDASVIRYFGHRG